MFMNSPQTRDYIVRICWSNVGQAEDDGQIVASELFQGETIPGLEGVVHILLAVWMVVQQRLGTNFWVNVGLHWPRR